MDGSLPGFCPWGFFRQEYWSGLPCPPPGDLPNPGIEPRSPTLQADSVLSEPPGKPTRQKNKTCQKATYSKLGKEYVKALYCHPAYLTYMQSTSRENAGLDETQAGIKTDRRNINNLRYADDTILMAEGEEELKSLLMKVKEESEKAGLKLNIQKMKIMASGPITSWQIDGDENGNSDRPYFLVLQNHCGQ